MANYNRNQIFELIRDGEYDRVEDIAEEVGASLTQSMTPAEVADNIMAAQAVRLVGNAGWRQPEIDDARGVFGRVKNWVTRLDEYMEEQPLITQALVAIISGLRFTTPDEVRQILAEEGVEAKLSSAAEDRIVKRVMAQLDRAMAEQREELLTKMEEAAAKTASTSDDDFIAQLRRSATIWLNPERVEKDEAEPEEKPKAKPKKSGGWRL